MRIRLLTFLSFFALLGFGLSSCGEDVQRSFTPTPAAFGQINSLVVLGDSSLWMNGAGDSVAYFFEAPYLILPQPEPIFDVRFVEPQRLAEEPTWQELRNYIVLADLSDDDSPTTQMVREDMTDAKLQQVKAEGFGTAVANNKWATGQQLVYLMGRDRRELLNGMSTVYPAIVNRLKAREAERQKVTTYFRGTSNRLADTVAGLAGARMEIPVGYDLVPLDDEDVAWLRQEVQGASLNIMVKRVPYEDASQLTKEGLKEIRNDIGKEYVSSLTDNTFMRVNDQDLPLFTESTRLNGNYAIEGRGIWEMENDFLAGPFVSYLINDTVSNQLVLVDGFVYAPGRKKRDLMEEVVQVIRTTEVN